MIADIVISSGYFNPLHSGHLNYLREAKKLAKHHIAIVNNDHQVQVKGSVPFMRQGERLQIIESLQFVDLGFISIDYTASVCESIEYLHDTYIKQGYSNFIFANGGDRTSAKGLLETPVCKRLGIEMAFQVGGGKTQSSSTLIANAKAGIL